MPAIAGEAWIKILVAHFLGRLAALFNLLDEGKIKPVIAMKLPILETVLTNALLERGQVIGNLVQTAPELL
jgi:NADPH:quinone reductase-like Zn-dependent oxidoreductase